MTISSKKFHLKSVLACAALALLFTTAQPNTAMALVAAVSDDGTPGTIPGTTPGTKTPKNNVADDNPLYKGKVASQISNAIATEKARVAQKRQLNDKSALDQVNGVHKMIDEAKKNGMTDDDIRKEFGVIGKTPPTPMPPTPLDPVPTAATPGTYNPNMIADDLKKRAVAYGWSDEVYQSELKAAMAQYYKSTQ